MGRPPQHRPPGARSPLLCQLRRLPPLPLLPLLLLGCAGAAPSLAASPPRGSAVVAPAAGRAGACSEVAPGAPGQDSPSLELQLKPLPGDGDGAIDVRMVLIADESELSSLRPPAALREPVEVRVSLERAGCDAARVPVNAARRVLRAEPGTPLYLGATRSNAVTRGHAVTGSNGTAAGAADSAEATEAARPMRLALEYRLDAAGTPLLDTRRFLAEGRQLFFAPSAPREASRLTRVAIDASAYGPDGRAVSSVGLGSERDAAMTQHAVDEAVFGAGYLGSAVFLASEGRDEAAWFGSPLFDLRPLAAEIASFRTAVRERLRDPWDTPLTTILSVEAGLSSFDVRRAPASVVVRVNPGQTLSAQLRLSILHQVLKEWIGGRLALVDDAGAEAVWFTEGVCRYLARQLAFEFGLLSPLEYLEELNGLLAIQSVLGAPEHAAACAAEASLPGGPFSGCQGLLALARGALLTGELDRLLSARGSSLTALLAGWLREARAPLTSSGWASALERDAGPAARALLARFGREEALVPPSAAFGACFTRASWRLTQSELGFEYERVSPATGGPRWLVTRVAEGSPAFAAGLRAQATLGAVDFAPYAADRAVRVLPADGQLLEYRPRTHAVPGVAWRRVAGVPDRLCLEDRGKSAGEAAKLPGGMRTAE